MHPLDTGMDPTKMKCFTMACRHQDKQRAMEIVSPTTKAERERRKKSAKLARRLSRAKHGK